MIDAGVNDYDLAKLCNASEGDVRAWRRGDNEPDLNQLIALSDALDVTLDELMGKVTDDAIVSARMDTGFDDDDSDDDHECYVAEEDGKHNWKWRKKYGVINAFRLFPFSMVCVIIYLVLGFAAAQWHPGWIIFLTVPIYKALTEDPIEEFPWSILVTIVYLLIGFTSGAWHPWWILYLTMPVWHFAVSLFTKNNKK